MNPSEFPIFVRKHDLDHHHTATQVLNVDKENGIQHTINILHLRCVIHGFNVNVRESTIGRTRNNDGVHGRVARRKPLLPVNNIDALLKFTKDHVDEPEG